MQMEALEMFGPSAHASTVLFRRFFYRKPSDGLSEIAERVYGEKEDAFCSHL